MGCKVPLLLSLVSVLITACTASGEHLSKYQDLSVHTSYSEVFRIDPIFKDNPNLYVQVRDLSGHNLNDEIYQNITKQIIANTTYCLTNNVSQADVIVYATVSDIYTNSKQSSSGVVVGAATGFTAGALLSDRRHSYYHHGSGDLATALFLGVIGAGIGYAIDDSLSVDTLVLNTNVEVMQLCEDGLWNKYSSVLTTTGQQLNMDQNQAATALIENVGKGISELIKY